MRSTSGWSLLLLVLFLTGQRLEAADVTAVRVEAAKWRSEHRIIDLHMHVKATEERYQRALKIMAEAGIGIGVNLSGGTVTKGADGGPSEFERNKTLADRVGPGRFLLHFNLDYQGWDDADWSTRAGG